MSDEELEELDGFHRGILERAAARAAEDASAAPQTGSNGVSNGVPYPGH